MKRRITAAAAAVAAGAVAAGLLVGGATGGHERTSIAKRAAEGHAQAATVKVTETTAGGATVAATKTLPFLSAGTVFAAKRAVQEEERAEAADLPESADIGVAADLGAGAGSVGCGRRESAGNVRVNQDCSFRRQAETDIAVNPLDGKNLIGGQNDSRVGFNQCGIDFSLDGGKHWGDMIPPFRQRFNDPSGELTATPVNSIDGELGTFHTYDAGSDPTVAFDADGRAFFSCIVFDVNSLASGLYVTGSPAGANGTFYNNIPATGRRFMVVEDNSEVVFHDKQFITADAYASSPNKNNVYVTWTVFIFDEATGAYLRSPIFASMSTDHAVTWSKPQKISTASDACVNGDSVDPTQPANACDFDQGSDPVVLPNGDLVVTYNNGNTPGIDGQQLSVHCTASGKSTDGTAKIACDPSVKVGDDLFADYPFCDFGRGPEQCIPGAFIRTNDFPRSAVSTRSGNVYVTWQDYRDGEIGIRTAMSSNGGKTWSATATVNPDTGLDHYMPAIDVAETSKGDRVAVSYYRTQQVPGERAGFAVFGEDDPGVGAKDSDYVVAGASDTAKPFEARIVSPVFPAPNNPAQIGFNGDYSGLAIGVGSQVAHPIWSDTRNTDPFNGGVNDEDVFTDGVPVPEGPGKVHAGVIGRR